MEILIPLFGIVFTFATPIAIVIALSVHKSKVRNQEIELQKKMVENGMEPKLEMTRIEKDPNTPLKVGAILIGAALGTLSGFFLDFAGLDFYVGIPAMVLLFVGISLVWFYNHVQKMDKK